jgi:hypothetical protein
MPGAPVDTGSSAPGLSGHSLSIARFRRCTTSAALGRIDGLLLMQSCTIRANSRGHVSEHEGL